MSRRGRAAAMSGRPAASAAGGFVDTDCGSLGVAPGDLLMVHGSLRKLGLARADFGEGGAEAILDALDEAVGPTGTLLMTMGSHYAADWVNQRPVAERGRLLAGTRAVPARGRAGQCRRSAGSPRRSGGGRGRWSAPIRAAASARAARARPELLADQPWDDYYGPGSPLQKFATGAAASCGSAPVSIP